MITLLKKLFRARAVSTTRVDQNFVTSNEKSIAEHLKLLESSPADLKLLTTLGSLYRDEGNLEKALECFKNTIRVNPTFAKGYFNIGLIAEQQGKTDDAISAYQKGLLYKNDGDVYKMVGDLFRLKHMVEEAKKYYLTSILHAPRNYAAHVDLGVLFFQQAFLLEAKNSFEKAIEIDPYGYDSLINLSKVLQIEKNPDQAHEYCVRALNINPSAEEPHSLLADILRCQGKYTEAERQANGALSLSPDTVNKHLVLGLIFQQQDRDVAAIDRFTHALTLYPNSVDLYMALGSSLQKQRRDQEAEKMFRRAVEIAPQHHLAQINLASYLVVTGKFLEAAEILKKTLSIEPSSVDALWVKATLLHEQKFYGEALNLLEQLITDNKENVLLHQTHSTLLLRLGDFSEGWKKYEYRLESPQLKPLKNRFAEYTKWNGESLEGKTILIYLEQGVGDTLHFIRYVKIIVELGAKVTVEMLPGMIEPLYPLLAGLTEQLGITFFLGGVLPKFDYYCPLLSIPGVIGTTKHNIPNTVPYLPKISSSLNDEWKDRIGQDKNFRIGIVWAGNPMQANDRNRSMPVSAFMPLADIPGVSLYSLQKGPGQKQLMASSLRVVDLSEELSNLAVTAAVIENLDLVISVDTSVAHLAGALGKPVWVLICHVPCWRYSSDSGTSLWYPTMRLFQQPAWGDWYSVIKSVVSELALYIVSTKNVTIVT